MADLKSIKVASQAIVKEIQKDYGDAIFVGTTLNTTHTILTKVKNWLDNRGHSYDVEYHKEEKNKA